MQLWPCKWKMERFESRDLVTNWIWDDGGFKQKYGFGFWFGWLDRWWCHQPGKKIQDKERLGGRLFVWCFGNVDFKETGTPMGFTQHSYILARGCQGWDKCRELRSGNEWRNPGWIGWIAMEFTLGPFMTFTHNSPIIRHHSWKFIVPLTAHHTADLKWIWFQIPEALFLSKKSGGSLVAHSLLLKENELLLDPCSSFLPQSSILQPSSRLLLVKGKLGFSLLWEDGLPWEWVAFILACQLYLHELISCWIFASLNDPEPDLRGDIVWNEDIRYIPEFQGPVLSRPLCSAGNLHDLSYLSGSEFPDHVKMGIIRNIPVLLFLTAGMIK